jgi:transcriptional regulator with XRE-family HTH domain
MRRLQRLRLQQFLTQQALADNVGVDIFTVQRWEAGDRFPRPQFLRTLCEVLGIDVTELVEPDEWPTKRQGKVAAAAYAINHSDAAATQHAPRLTCPQRWAPSQGTDLSVTP